MKLIIGDKTYEFEYTINALCDLEKVTGKTFSELMNAESMTNIRGLLWCGLIANQKTITLEQAGALLLEYIKTNTLEELTALVGDAFEQAGFLQALARKKPRVVK